MTFPNGLYYIQSAKQSESFVGTGPIPPIWPPYPSPLKLVNDYMKDTYVLESKGGDTCTLKHKILGLFIGFDDSGVRLVPAGGKTPEWAIDPGNSSLFRLHVPNKDKYWTASDKDFRQIEIQGANGNKAQGWKLIPAHSD